MDPPSKKTTHRGRQRKKKVTPSSKSNSIKNGINPDQTEKSKSHPNQKESPIKINSMQVSVKLVEPNEENQSVSVSQPGDQIKIKILNESRPPVTEVTGIVVVMIVKNESRIIARCLDQTKSIIKGVCITDTGSTDNCIECINKWGEENKIPCRVPIGEFRNFGYSRTLSFLNSRRFFPNASYYLLLDADLNLVIRSEWDESKLTHDGYKIYQQTATSRYQNIRLIKANKPWRCTGVTHEYWECQGATQSLLHSIEIDDKDDGGCKQDKYPRDERLLLEGIADNNTPNHLKGRYRFYLAQTYLCMKQYDDSIREYQARIDIGGWDEEVWYSQFQIGKAYIASDRPEMGIATLLKAWNMRPKRAEPLQDIAKYYREKSMNQLGYHFARLAYKQGYPFGDSLFIDQPTYDYLIDLEISINAFYVGKKEIGCQAHLRLKKIYNQLPNWVKTCVDGNNKFYRC